MAENPRSSAERPSNWNYAWKTSWLVAAHEREQVPKNPTDLGDDAEQFFDESKVPVEVIQVPNPEVEGLDREDYEVIGEKVSHRLAQRPGSYVILKYVRPVIKRRDTQALSRPPRSGYSTAAVPMSGAY